MPPKAPVGIVPRIILRSGGDLSIGARVIFPYLTAFAVLDRKTRQLEISTDLILNYLQVPPFTVMQWMKDLAKAKYIVEPHYIERPRECVRFNFAARVLDEINAATLPRRKSSTSG